jgi:hypothetical protein
MVESWPLDLSKRNRIATAIERNDMATTAQKQGSDWEKAAVPALWSKKTLAIFFIPEPATRTNVRLIYGDLSARTTAVNEILLFLTASWPLSPNPPECRSQRERRR